jgi:hypothetical protein
MHTKFGKNKSMIELENSILGKIEKATYKARELFLGKCTKFMHGKYRGRWGKINTVMFDGTEGILVCITPFSIKNGQVGRLMHDNEESRFGRKLTTLDVFADYVHKDSLTNYKG